MAGGIWSATEKPVLPGLYMNFQAAALAAITAGSRGTVAVPVKAHWGPLREFVTLTREAEVIAAFTASEADGATAYRTCMFALMGGAKKVLAYRIADDDAALATRTLVDTTAEPVSVIRIDAKYMGERGNAFKLTVRVNPIDASKKDILLYEGTALLRTFTFTSGDVDNAVDAINDDPANIWIDAVKLADGNGTLADITTQAMASGDSGADNVLAADYTEFLAACETQEINLLALDGTSDAGIQTSTVTWVDRVRSEGKGVIAVLGGASGTDTGATAVADAIARSAGFNHEGVVNVGVGAELDGVDYSSAQISAYVAGLIAGQRLSESTTYAATPFDDVTRRWTRPEMELAVTGGVFLLIHDGRQVKVLRGMNSRTTLEQGQNNAWKKIRTIRVMDAINADLQRTAEDSYIGKINNTEEGRLALIGACKQYMETLVQGGVIETGYSVELDPTYYGTGATITPEADQVYLIWQARLTDVMEIILGTFKVM